MKIYWNMFKTFKGLRRSALTWASLLVTPLFLRINAQQDPMYTQYMFNPLAVNPAYAGSLEGLSVVGLMRAQWLGIDKAPRTQTLTLHAPYYKWNAGFGLSIVNDAVGPVKQTMFFVDYSYDLKVGWTGHLRLGLQGGFSLLDANLTGLNPDEPLDPDIFDIKGKFLPNVGIGIFYHDLRGYAGLSVPKLIRNNINEVNSNREIGLVKRHWFLMGGYVFDLQGEDIKLKPSFVLKMVEGAPVSMDFSGIVYFYEKFGVGLAYRYHDAISGILQLYIKPNFQIGYSYDFTLTKLRNPSMGSHELMIKYDFLYVGRGVIHHPRFF